MYRLTEVLPDNINDPTVRKLASKWKRLEDRRIINRGRTINSESWYVFKTKTDLINVRNKLKELNGKYGYTRYKSRKITRMPSD
jgi:hypothetical protein